MTEESGAAYRLRVCWSATADLVAGAGIIAVGVVCVARVRRARDLPLVVAYGAVLCAALWRPEFVSTWCALVAVASVLVY